MNLYLKKTVLVSFLLVGFSVYAVGGNEGAIPCESTAGTWFSWAGNMISSLSSISDWTTHGAPTVSVKFEAKTPTTVYENSFALDSDGQFKGEATRGARKKIGRVEGMVTGNANANTKKIKKEEEGVSSAASGALGVGGTGTIKTKTPTIPVWCMAVHTEGATTTATDESGKIKTTQKCAVNAGPRVPPGVECHMGVGIECSQTTSINEANISTEQSVFSQWATGFDAGFMSGKATVTYKQPVRPMTDQEKDLRKQIITSDKLIEDLYEKAIMHSYH